MPNKLNPYQKRALDERMARLSNEELFNNLCWRLLRCSTSTTLAVKQLEWAEARYVKAEFIKRAENSTLF